MYVPVSTPQPSPQATELGHKLAGVIQEYLTQNPGVSGTEVMQAFGVARSLLPGNVSGAAAKAGLLIAISVGMLLLGILVALFVARSG